MAAAFACLALLSLALFLHPYIFYPFSLRLFPDRPLHAIKGAISPSATAMFSAFNEERSMPAKLVNLMELRRSHPAIELLAYCDHCTDDTQAILGRHPELLNVLSGESRAGKATGMGRMVAAAHGDICIFTDANVILDPASIDPLLAYFSDPDVGGVAGALHYVNDDASTTAQVGGFYWRMEERLKRLESRCGSIMGADGSIFAVRRSLYPIVPPHLLDDMIASMSVTFRGKRLIHATDVIAYEKNVTSSSEEFRRKRRIACRAFNSHRYLWPMIRQTYGAADLYKYLSHKLLRWFGLPFLIGAALFLGLALLADGNGAWVGALVACGCVAYALGDAGVGPLKAANEILLSIAATFLGVFDSLAGRTYQTWTPALSRD